VGGREAGGGGLVAGAGRRAGSSRRAELRTRQLEPDRATAARPEEARRSRRDSSPELPKPVLEPCRGHAVRARRFESVSRRPLELYVAPGQRAAAQIQLESTGAVPSFPDLSPSRRALLRQCCSWEACLRNSVAGRPVAP
jgi:hypothetical protein